MILEGLIIQKTVRETLLLHNINHSKILYHENYLQESFCNLASRSNQNQSQNFCSHKSSHRKIFQRSCLSQFEIIEKSRIWGLKLFAGMQMDTCCSIWRKHWAILRLQVFYLYYTLQGKKIRNLQSTMYRFQHLPFRIGQMMNGMQVWVAGILKLLKWRLFLEYWDLFNIGWLIKLF